MHGATIKTIRLNSFVCYWYIFVTLRLEAVAMVLLKTYDVTKW
jgi:hypothetical protein